MIQHWKYCVQAVASLLALTTPTAQLTALDAWVQDSSQMWRATDRAVRSARFGR